MRASSHAEGMATRRAIPSRVTRSVTVLMSALRMPGFENANRQFSIVYSAGWPGLESWKLLSRSRKIG